MPSAAFAADLFSDGTAVEFAAEETDAFAEDAAAPAEEAAVFAEEADTEDVALQADGVVGEYKFEFLYGTNKEDELKVNYKLYAEDGTTVLEEGTVNATKVSETEECGKVPRVTLEAKVNGVTKKYIADKVVYLADGTPKKAEIVDHKWKDIEGVSYGDKVVHGAWNMVYPKHECERCGKIEADMTRPTQTYVDHNWGEIEYVAGSNIKTNEKDEVVFDENGVPVLLDESMDGTYYKKVTCKDDKAIKYVDKDGNKTTDPVPFTVHAKKIEYATITIADTDNIKNASEFVGKEYSLDELPLKEDKIQFKDCTKKGSYTIHYFSYSKDEELDKEVITIEAPHHFAKKLAPKWDKKYDDIMNVVDDKVVNNSCNVTVEYEEITECATCHTVLNKETKVAKPQGAHLIDTATKKLIANMKGKSAAELLKAVEKNDVVKITNDTSTCDQAGTVTVEYLCTVCKAAAETQTVNVPAKNHGITETNKTGDTVDKKENRVEPTCTKEGSYDAVSYCKYCNKVMSKKTIVLPKAKHTNDKDLTDKTVEVKFVGDLVVDYNGNMLEKDAEYDPNTYSVKSVEAKAHTLCTVCGENEKIFVPVKVKIDKVVKEGKNCQPGSITLTATYVKTQKDVKGEKVVATGTFDYYSSLAAYQARTAHDPAPAVKENVVEATATENGSYDEVVYCTVCGTEISRKTVTVNATGEVVLPAVTGLTAKTTGMNRVALSWDKVEGAEGYFIMGLGEGRTGTQIAYTTRTSWTDTAADSDAFNFYWVQPFNRNAAGKIVKGDLGGYVYALGRVVSATGKVTAVATEDGIELNWASVSGANSYVVLSKTGDAKAEFNASVATDTTTYVDTTAEAGEVNYYWVYATYKNADGKVLAAGKTSPFAWAVAK